MSKTPIFIGVGGGTASGKTSVATLLANVSQGVPVISLDHFYLECKGDGESHNWDDPDSFDWILLIECMNKWKSGQSAWIPRHDFSEYRRVNDAALIEVSPVMIFEGIHMFHDARVNHLLDLKVFIDCDPDEALCRRIKRDMEERHYNLDVILTRYRKHVKPAYDRWILPTRNIVDVVIVNGIDKDLTSHKGLNILFSYIKTKL